MVSIISLLLILTISILVNRIATVALTHTGLSRESARFQARSAFTGVGFTTSESEKVVGHPVRRRILMVLMLLGNVGIISAMSTLILSFIDVGEAWPVTLRIVLLVAGLVVLWSIASSQWIDHQLAGIIDMAIKRSSHLEIHDYADLLRLSKDYRIAELKVRAEDWLAGKSLAKLKLRDEGIMVLGILRNDGTYIGAPKGTTVIRAEDSLVLYGRESAHMNIDRRGRTATGDHEHDVAVAEQKKVVHEEKREDPAERTENNV